LSLLNFNNYQKIIIMTKQISIAILISLSFLFSCNSTKKSSNKDEIKKTEVQKIEKGEYIITKIKGLEELTKKPTMIIDFKAKTVSGNASCNRYGGSIITEGNSIKFNRLITTKMYCAKFDKIERTFMKMLSLVITYEIKENQILFYDKANTLLIVGDKK